MSVPETSDAANSRLWNERNDIDAQALLSVLSISLKRFLIKHKLGEAYQSDITNHYLPMAAWICEQSRGDSKPLIIGINGAQGSGKSTLTELLTLLLVEGMGKRVLSLSIDDLYHGHQHRQQMAREVHPLFATRGVPGTHDVELGRELFETLRSSTVTSLRIPRFDKASDDRRAESEWDDVSLPVDIVLFEGWCVGAHPQSEAQLQQPVNELEAEEDSTGEWRKAVNNALATDYPSWFKHIDRLIMLKVPSILQVLEWRGQQERALAVEGVSGYQGMGDMQLLRFVRHFERLTRHQLKEMPGRADMVLELGENHAVRGVRMPER